MSSRQRKQSSPAPAKVSASRVEVRCPHCGLTVTLEDPRQPARCSACHEKISKIALLDQYLARWFEPRRWRADLVRPSVPYLLERLWTANGQGLRLYEGVSPQHTNYDIFRNMVTRLIIRGVDEGWAELTFPPDPFVEDPRYELRIADTEKFASGVEKLFPEVDWDERIEIPGQPSGQPAS